MSPRFPLSARPAITPALPTPFPAPASTLTRPGRRGDCTPLPPLAARATPTEPAITRIPRLVQGRRKQRAAGARGKAVVTPSAPHKPVPGTRSSVAAAPASLPGARAETASASYSRKLKAGTARTAPKRRPQRTAAAAKADGMSVSRPAAPQDLRWSLRRRCWRRSNDDEGTELLSGRSLPMTAPMFTDPFEIKGYSPGAF